MYTFWEIIASNAMVATILAIGAMLLGRIWKNAAAVHVLWVVVLLKLFTPPLITAELPFAFPFVPSAASADSRKRPGTRPYARGATNSSRCRDEFPRGDCRGNPRRTLGNRSTETAGPSRGHSPPSSPPFGLAAPAARAWPCRPHSPFCRVIRESEAAPPAIRTMVTAALEPAGSEARARRPDDVSCSAAPGLVDRTLPAHDFAFRTLCPPEHRSSRHNPRPRTLPYPARRLSRPAPRARGEDGLLVASRRVVGKLAVAELEEQCCDGRVLELVPASTRTYAAALVDTLEFLSERPRTLVPLRTAIYPTGSLSRRTSHVDPKPNESSECPECHARRRTCRPSAGRCLRRRSGTGEQDRPPTASNRPAPNRGSPRSRDQRGGRSPGRCSRARRHSRRGYAIRRCRPERDS